IHGRFGVVSGKIFGSPDVHAGSLTGLEAPSRGNKEQPTPAADIQNSLVAAPGNAVEDAVDYLGFGDPAAPHHDGCNDYEREPDGEQHARDCHSGSSAGGAIRVIEKSR